MMEFVADLAGGFGTAASPANLLYCLIGVTLGTLVGVLPGIGPVASLSMLLPITFTLPADGALIMLAGIYYGSQYGGSTTAILVNIPGEAGSVVTCLDGHQMALQGRAGPALAIAAFASFFAGCVATIIIAAAAPALAAIAMSFRSPEYFSLMVLGLAGGAMLGHKSILKSAGMVLAGVLLGCVGTDVTTGLPRYTFGFDELRDGIEFVGLAVGLFAIGDIVTSIGSSETGSVLRARIKRMLPSRRDVAESWGAAVRGTAVGSFFGVLPGAGTVIASFAAYTVEKRLSREPERFGQGAVEGLAAPEAANNAAAQTSFIPTLTLGIPASATMAVMLGALTIQGIVPGPEVITKYPDLFWGLVASMWIGNALLLVLNLPLVPIWVKFLRIPMQWLSPSIVLFCCLGAFSVGNSPFDVMLIAVFGLFGFVLLKLDFEPAPLLMGFVLGPMLEENMRRSLLLSRGDPLIFVQRPLSLAFLGITVLLVTWFLYRTLSQRQ